MITPELIGPYLAYSPTLETLDGPQVLSIELLTTIENIDTMHPGTKQGFYADSTLRLRNFSSLTLPLPSGEVPIVEIAKLALNDNYEPTRRMYQLYEFKRARVPRPYPKEAYAYIDHRKLESKTIKVDADFNVTVSNAVSIRGVNTYNQAAIIDYLRRNHFAVGLEPHQYIPLQP